MSSRGQDDCGAVIEQQDSKMVLRIVDPDKFFLPSSKGKVDELVDAIINYMDYNIRLGRRSWGIEYKGQLYEGTTPLGLTPEGRFRGPYDALALWREATKVFSKENFESALSKLPIERNYKAERAARLRQAEEAKRAEREKAREWRETYARDLAIEQARKRALEMKQTREREGIPVISDGVCIALYKKEGHVITLEVLDQDKFFDQSSRPVVERTFKKIADEEGDGPVFRRGGKVSGAEYKIALAGRTYSPKDNAKIFWEYFEGNFTKENFVQCLVHSEKEFLLNTFGYETREFRDSLQRGDEISAISKIDRLLEEFRQKTIPESVLNKVIDEIRKDMEKQYHLLPSGSSEEYLLRARYVLKREINLKRLRQENAERHPEIVSAPPRLPLPLPPPLHLGPATAAAAAAMRQPTPPPPPPVSPPPLPPTSPRPAPTDRRQVNIKGAFESSFFGVE